MTKDISILVVITLVAGLLLGLAYHVTEGPIAQTQAQQRIDAQKEVMPEASDFELIYSEDEADEEGQDAESGEAAALAEMDIDFAGAIADITSTEVTEVDAALDESGEIIGYVVTSVNSEGYGGDIELMTGVKVSDDETATVTGIAFLSLSETAGMGMKAEDDEFKDQFGDLTLDAGQVIEYSKNGASASNEIDAISGCTVTTSAVTKAANAAVESARAAEEAADGTSAAGSAQSETEADAANQQTEAEAAAQTEADAGKEAA